jgi:hypothetical protein
VPAEALSPTDLDPTSLAAPLLRPRSSVHQRARANSNWMKQLSSASFVTPIKAMNQLDQLLFDQARLLLKLDASFYSAASQLASSWREQGGSSSFRHAAVIKQLLQQHPPEGALPQQGRAACGLVQPRAPARE